MGMSKPAKGAMRAPLAKCQSCSAVVFREDSFAGEKPVHEYFNTEPQYRQQWPPVRKPLSRPSRGESEAVARDGFTDENAFAAEVFPRLALDEDLHVLDAGKGCGRIDYLLELAGIAFNTVAVVHKSVA